MNENKHTPGPWKVVNGWNPDGSPKGDSNLFPSVIMVEKNDPRKSASGRTFYFTSCTINMSHNQQAESIMANARLIAAAPDLLEALIGMTKLMDDILPQIGGLCIQDYGLLNDTLMLTTSILKKIKGNVP